MARRLYGVAPSIGTRLRHRLFRPGRRSLRVAKGPGGLLLWVDASERVGGDLYFGQPYEPVEMRLFMMLAPPGAVVIDVGANVGQYALLAARLVGPAGRVHAFEPASATYGLLQRSIALNGLQNLVLNQVAVSDSSGDVELQLNRESALAGLGVTGRGFAIGSERVHRITLDEYAAGAGLGMIDLLKIDVEGHEGHVLRGAETLLERSPAVVVLTELADKNFAPLGLRVDDVIDRMRALGFESWRINAQNAAFARPATRPAEVLSSELATWR